jgi:hypothetical protein
MTTTATKRAVKRYGETLCRKAYELHQEHGNGARTVAYMLGLPGTNAADAAIDAGRELVTGEREPQS